MTADVGVLVMRTTMAMAFQRMVVVNLDFEVGVAGILRLLVDRDVLM